MINTFLNEEILTWTPSPLDVLANKRNGGEIIQARARIGGYWYHSRFFNYSYTPSSAYMLKRLKFLNPKLKIK